MKKYFFLFIFFLNLSIFGNAQALCEEKCSIYDGTPAVIEDYLQDTRRAVQNITTELQKNQSKQGLDKDYSRLKSSLIRSYNLVSNWDGYYSYFKFYVNYSIQNEYVAEIRRDYDRLNMETKGIESYIRSLGTRGYQDIVLSQEVICANISSNCNFSGNAQDVLLQIAANHEKVKEQFRRNILGMTGEKLTIQLVGEKFQEEFKKYYNENTTTNCSMCEGGYWDRVSETMDRISQNMEYSKNATQEWKKAWALLTGGLDEKQYQRIERDFLSRELGRQGVSAEQGERVLQNLDEFNKNGLSTVMSNNFITNSFDYFVKMISPQTESFTQTFLATFGDRENQKESVSINEFNKGYKNITQADEIQQRIDILYQEQQSIMSVQSAAIDEIIAKMIQMHYNLSKSSGYLKDAEKKFEGACKYQANGRGNCE